MAITICNRNELDIRNIRHMLEIVLKLFVISIVFFNFNLIGICDMQIVKGVMTNY